MLKKIISFILLIFLLPTLIIIAQDDTSTSEYTIILSGYPVKENPDNDGALTTTGAAGFQIELALDEDGNPIIENNWVQVILKRGERELEAWIPQAALSNGAISELAILEGYPVKRNPNDDGALITTGTAGYEVELVFDTANNLVIEGNWVQVALTINGWATEAWIPQEALSDSRDTSEVIAEVASLVPITENNAPYLENFAQLGKGEVNQMLWSQDGSQLYIATSSGIYVYSDGEEEPTVIESPYGSVWSINFNSNGDLLAITGHSSIHLWNVTADIAEEVLETPIFQVFQEVHATFFSPDASVFTILLNNLNVSLFDTATGQRIATRDNVRDVVFSADSRTLYVAVRESSGEIYEIQQLDTATGDVIHTFSLKGLPWAIDLAPDGGTLAVVGYSDFGDAIQIYDTKIGELISEFRDDSIISSLGDIISFSNDGVNIIYIKGDTIQYWNPNTGQDIPTLRCEGCSNHIPVFNPDNPQQATTVGNAVVIRNATTGSPEKTIDGFGEISEIFFGANEHQLIYVQSGIAVIYNTQNAEIEQQLDSNREWGISADSRILVSEGIIDVSDAITLRSQFQDRIDVWDTGTVERIARFQVDGVLLSDVAISPDGHLVITWGFDLSTFNYIVQLWNVETGHLEGTLVSSEDEHEIGPIAWSSDSNYVALAMGQSLTNRIYLWNIDEQRLIDMLYPDTNRGRAYTLTFNNASDRLAAGSTHDVRGNVRVWDMSGRVLATSTIDTTGINDVMFTSDDSFILSAPIGRPILYLDAETLQHVGPTDYEDDSIRIGGAEELVLIPNTDLVVSGGTRGMIGFEYLRSGESLVTLQDHTSPISNIRINSDGTLLATLSSSNVIHLWRVPSNLCIVKPTDDIALREGPSFMFNVTGYITSNEPTRVISQIVSQDNVVWFETVDHMWVQDIGLQFEGECDNIPVSEPSDFDGDTFTDELDNCPIESNSSQLDTDNDGFGDVCDLCSDVSGSVNGCPDSDGDNVADAVDQCPNLVGIEATNGCPDADEDGVIDTDDLCPDEAGLPELDGCLPRGTTSTTANLRAGTGTGYAVVGSVSANTEFTILGRNEAGDWLHILILSEEPLEAWIFGDLVITEVDVLTLPIQE